MKQTKREALTDCRARWVWVSEDKNRNKRDWPGSKLPEGRDCECCWYNDTHDGCWCGEYCLIRWPGVPCSATDSPYEKWYNAHYSADPSDCPKYALEIVKLCDEALARLPKRKKVKV